MQDNFKPGSPELHDTILRDLRTGNTSKLDDRDYRDDLEYLRAEGMFILAETKSGVSILGISPKAAALLSTGGFTKIAADKELEREAHRATISQAVTAKRALLIAILAAIISLVALWGAFRH